MTREIAVQATPRIGKAAGLLNLAAMAAGAVVLAVRSAVIARSADAATASDILSSEPVLRLGGAANLIGVAVYGAMTLLLNEAYVPVKFSLSLLAALSHWAGEAGSMAHVFFNMAPVMFHAGVHYLATML